MFTLALVSDLHANLTAWKALNADLAQRKPSQVVILGDLVGYFSRPNEMCSQVAATGWPCLLGNYDQAVITGGPKGCSTFLKPGIGPIPQEIFHWTDETVDGKSRDFLNSLPSSLELTLSGRRVVAFHGSPSRVNEYVYPDHPQEDLDRWVASLGADILCLGHTHRPFVRRAGGGALMVNPGSVGKPKDGDPRASYALVSIGREISAVIIRLDFATGAEASLNAGAGLPSY